MNWILIVFALWFHPVEKKGLKLDKAPLEVDTCLNYYVRVIKYYEKYKAERYELFGDHYIGYGHLLSSSDTITHLNEVQADSLLRADFEKGLKMINLKVSKNKRYVLACFVYNCGIGALKRSDLYKNPGGITRYQYLKYCYAGGKRINKLVERREKEFLLWNVK